MTPSEVRLRSLGYSEGEVKEIGTWAGDVVRRDHRVWRPPPPNRHHPTLLDVQTRELEIEEWERQQALAAVVERRWTLGSALGGVGLIVLALFILTAAPVALFVAVPVLGLTMWALAIRREITSYIPLPRHLAPRQLELVEFTYAENRSLLRSEEPRPLTALCTCPGCEFVAVHYFDPPHSDFPGVIIRSCRTEGCGRKWAQL